MLGWQNQMVNSSNPGCEVLVRGLSWILYHGEILILCWSLSLLFLHFVGESYVPISAGTSPPAPTPSDEILILFGER